MKRFKVLIYFSTFLIHSGLVYGQFSDILSETFNNRTNERNEKINASSEIIYSLAVTQYRPILTDSLEDLFLELKEKKIKTFFELRGGIEVFRKIAAAGIGLPLQFSERFILVPEFSFISVPILSISYRYRFYFPRFRLNIQPGFGYTYFYFINAPCAIIALGGQYILGRKISLLLELKTVFIHSSPNTRGLSVEGADIIKSPPTSLSIGFSF